MRKRNTIIPSQSKTNNGRGIAVAAFIAGSLLLLAGVVSTTYTGSISIESPIVTDITAVPPTP